MKILLIEHPRNVTPERCNDIANTPLSSCLLSGYAAGMLKAQGHDVEIIEGYLDSLSYDEILKISVDLDPDIIGIHMVYSWQSNDRLYCFINKLKNELHETYITTYGFYPTVSYRDILSGCSAIDSVIVGETEPVFPELAMAVSSGRRNMRLQGLAVKSADGRIYYQPSIPIDNLDLIPFPVRTDALNRIQDVNILGSRGCYGKCTFCYIGTFFGGSRSWRGRSPENIASEIDEVISSTGRRDFYFTDPNFFGPGKTGQERALKIAGLLKTRGIRFGIEARVNDINDKAIAALVDAGLRHILVGLESGSDESLKRMNKMTTVAQNEDALRVLRRHGIEPNVGFIMFEPDSSVEDIRTNFEFLKRNRLLENLSVTANVLYHHQIVLKGTSAYHILNEEKRLGMQESDYEGTASFKNHQVGMLAEIMRRVTNFVFQCMDSIWSGSVIPLPLDDERYSIVNRLLVDAFENNLDKIENDVLFDPSAVESIADGVIADISEVMSADGYMQVNENIIDKSP